MKQLLDISDRHLIYVFHSAKATTCKSEQGNLGNMRRNSSKSAGGGGNKNGGMDPAFSLINILLIKKILTNPHVISGLILERHQDWGKF